MAEQDRIDAGETGARAPAGGVTAAAAQPRAALAEEQVVYRADGEPGVHGAQRSAFDLAATLGGLLAAIGALVVLSAILSAILGTSSQTGADDEALGLGAAIGSVIALFLALLAGGWVAGRMARHRGAWHGLMTAVEMVLLLVLLAALGAWLGSRFDLFERLGVSQFTNGDAGALAVIGALLALGAMFLGGWLGGRLGERHRTAAGVEVVETRHRVAKERGGIISNGSER